VRDLRAAARRFETQAPTTAAVVSRLLYRVRQRRLVLLEATVAERLRRAAAEGEGAEPFELALDLYRLHLSGEPRLVAPIRSFMRQRNERSEWRRALLQLESMSLIRCGAFDEVAGYDVDYLLDLLSGGLRDNEVGIAELTATLAARLIDKGLITRIGDFSALEFDLKRAGNLFDPVPEGFAVLQQSIVDARRHRGGGSIG
jgi:hypothetical protein